MLKLERKHVFFKLKNFKLQRVKKTLNSLVCMRCIHRAAFPIRSRKLEEARYEFVWIHLWWNRKRTVWMNGEFCSIEIQHSCTPLRYARSILNVNREQRDERY